MTPLALKSLLAQHPDIRLAYLFGSLARGEARADSDLDLAILTEDPLTPERKILLIEELALASGRAIDLIDLKEAGEPLLGEILGKGIRVKGANSLHAELIARHLFDSADFLPYVRRMLAERRAKWTH